MRRSSPAADMEKLTDLLKRELARLKGGTEVCTVCGDRYYKDEMKNLDGATCLPCSE